MFTILLIFRWILQYKSKQFISNICMILDAQEFLTGLAVMTTYYSSRKRLGKSKSSKMKYTCAMRKNTLS